VVPIRVLPARSLPLARLAAPAILVAAGLSLGAAQGPLPGSERPVADQVRYAAPTAVMPFAAAPRSYPFATHIVETRRTLPPGVDGHGVSATPSMVTLSSTPVATTGTVPGRVLAAYVNATRLTNAADPQCRVRWEMLAGIGFVESDNALDGGSTSPGWNGVANPPIFGPLVNGKGRAIGPMQIMASSWAVYAADGNHDGVRDPQDIDDASLAAAHYLCAASQRLNQPAHLIRALHAYNRSYIYVRDVLTAIASYLRINPAKLGINRLPQAARRGVVRIGTAPRPPAVQAAPTPSPAPTGPPTPTPVPRPTQSWTPPPSPTPTPPPPHRPGS
jgi:hypothetical protein